MEHTRLIRHGIERAVGTEIFARRPARPDSRPRADRRAAPRVARDAKDRDRPGERRRSASGAARREIRRGDRPGARLRWTVDDALRHAQAINGLLVERAQIPRYGVGRFVRRRRDAGPSTCVGRAVFFATRADELAPSPVDESTRRLVDAQSRVRHPYYLTLRSDLDERLQDPVTLSLHYR